MPQNGYAEHHENLKEKTQPKGPGHLREAHLS